MPDDQRQPTALIHYDAARHALAQAVQIDDVKHIRDMAVAAQTYARQAEDRQLLDNATEIRRRAERRAGELLQEMMVAGERHDGRTLRGKDVLGLPATTPEVKPTLSDLGISKNQSSNWQRLARLSEEDFERTVEAAKEKVITSLDGKGRPDPAAQRGQPNRDGPDFWPTPPCLATALVRHVLPDLPPAQIWECAAGDGRLVRALREVGCNVLASDLYPPDGRHAVDFLDTPPRWALGSIVVTNPPFNQSDEFLTRGLELLDTGQIAGLVLLLRHDHLMAAGRVDAFNRAVREVHCNWRPRWIADTDGNPRWSFHWLVWHAGERRPPLYLHEPEAAA